NSSGAAWPTSWRVSGSAGTPWPASQTSGKTEMQGDIVKRKAAPDARDLDGNLSRPRRRAGTAGPGGYRMVNRLQGAGQSRGFRAGGDFRHLQFRHEEHRGERDFR